MHFTTRPTLHLSGKKGNNNHTSMDCQDEDDNKESNIYEPSPFYRIVDVYLILIFPTLFVLFNALYWPSYIV